MYCLFVYLLSCLFVYAFSCLTPFSVIVYVFSLIRFSKMFNGFKWLRGFHAVQRDCLCVYLLICFTAWNVIFECLNYLLFKSIYPISSSSTAGFLIPTSLFHPRFIIAFYIYFHGFFSNHNWRKWVYHYG